MRFQFVGLVSLFYCASILEESNLWDCEAFPRSAANQAPELDAGAGTRQSVINDQSDDCANDRN